MICLFCKDEIAGDPPLKCEGCDFVHQSRPPIVGVNHISQLLAGLDLLAEDEISVDDFEALFNTFLDHLEDLERKWQLREALMAERLSSALQAKFLQPFKQLDEALQLAYQGVEWVEAYLSEEAESLDEAIDCFVTFFQGICGASALILDRLDDFENNKGSGMLFNLPSA